MSSENSSGFYMYIEPLPNYETDLVERDEFGDEQIEEYYKQRDLERNNWKWFDSVEEAEAFLEIIESEKQLKQSIMKEVENEQG